MGKIISVSKMTVRYQITIPPEVRQIIKINDGESVVFVEDNGKIILRNSKLD